MTLRIALIGNPNTGKSSLFNALTGLKQKVGNFPGVTVEKSIGHFSFGERRLAEIVDLPGTYSLFPKSLDEAIPFDVLLDPKHPQHPDLIIFIADASNLKRNLVLLTQLIDLQVPMILALNMVDQAKAKGISIDFECLEQQLDLPVVPIVARKRLGIDLLLSQIDKGGRISGKSFINVETLPVLSLATEGDEVSNFSPYQSVLRLHYATNYSGRGALSLPNRNDLAEPKFDSGRYQREDLLYRYKRINQILESCSSELDSTRFKRRQERIDAVLTHKVGGYVIFFAVLFLIFQAIFNLAEYPMHLIETGFSWLSGQVQANFPQGILNDLISNGIMAGLSGVLVFIPQIAFLFLFISLMEDTGYLARVAFLMDRSMRRLGLNGKSVIPLISGTACAVPAILATRNIESRKARLITILVTPLMSCSARLPVYILLIGMIIPADRTVLGFLNMQGLILMAMYVLGFLAVIGAATLYKTVLKSKVKQYFILEMPVYRMPNWSNVGLTVYKKVRTFIEEAGKIIIAIAVILWFLASFGPPGTFQQIEKKHSGSNIQTEAARKEVNREIKTEKLEASYAGRMGKAIEPVIAPLGYDWKIGIAIVTSFAAREVFVGTMATLYGLEGDNPDFSQLKANMLSAKDPVTKKPVYSLATVLSLLVFYAFALQCMSTIAVTYKETASAKWTLIQFGFMTALAYLSSLLVFQLFS